MILNETLRLFKQNLLAAQANPETLKNFKSMAHASLDDSFAVYRNRYISRLSGVLELAYPAVRWVLGKDYFSQVCRKYIESLPSVSYNLVEYGDSFADFLRTMPGTRSIPFLFDLARFEWILNTFKSVAPPHPLPAERIRELMHSEDFKVNFTEGTTVFESPFAIYEIWKQRSSPAYSFEELNWTHPEWLLLNKKDSEIQISQIDSIEGEILKELQSGSSIASALADYSTLLTPDKIAQLFQLMISVGAVEDILVTDESYYPT